MNIYQKISAVMKDVQYLSKDDRVEFKSTKYKAISEEKVTSAVRESLIRNGLVILPVWQDHKKTDLLTTVDVKYRIVNIENPEEFIEVVSSGTGVDTQDKGVGKAMTYAYKYMLLRTFAIPTGEDPDKISSAELDEKLLDNQKSDNGPQRTEKYVTVPMINTLKSEVSRIGWNLDGLLEWLKVSEIEKVTVEKFTYAMSQMKQKPDKR